MEVCGNHRASIDDIRYKAIEWGCVHPTIAGAATMRDGSTVDSGTVYSRSHNVKSESCVVFRCEGTTTETTIPN